MKISFTEESWKDFEYWLKTNKKIVNKINTLIKEIQRSPFNGTGKPEPLKHELQGYWSRRIDMEHRLVYKVTNNELLILSCRFHY